MVDQAHQLLKLKDLESINTKLDNITKNTKEDLKKQGKKTPSEINDIVIEKIREIIDFIVDEDYLGKDRFNQLTAHLRPECPLPHVRNLPKSNA